MNKLAQTPNQCNSLLYNPIQSNEIKISADSPSLMTVSEQGVEQNRKWKHSQFSCECS